MRRGGAVIDKYQSIGVVRNNECRGEINLVVRRGRAKNKCRVGGGEVVL